MRPSAVYSFIKGIRLLSLFLINGRSFWVNSTRSKKFVSKTAVNAFTVHLAAALSGTRIKVNSAHPGWVRTDMGGPQAPRSPVDGVKTAVWLAILGPDRPTGKFFHREEQVPW